MPLPGATCRTWPVTGFNTTVTYRCWRRNELKKRIVRTLIEEILVDADEESARIQMAVRWAVASTLSFRPGSRVKGQHRYTTDRKVVEIVRELAAMVPDGQIARILNRLGLRTGRNNSWTAGRVLNDGPQTLVDEPGFRYYY